MIMRPEVKKSYLNNMFPKGLGENLIPPSALRRMEQPFLLVHGFEDRFVAKESSLSMMQVFPTLSYILLKDAVIGFKLKKENL